MSWKGLGKTGRVGKPLRLCLHEWHLELGVGACCAQVSCVEWGKYHASCVRPDPGQCCCGGRDRRCVVLDICAPCRCGSPSNHGGKAVSADLGKACSQG